MKVAVAVICHEDKVLITRRAMQLSHGGFWEFPGGKLEEDESAISALIREVQEEVGLIVQEYHLLGEIKHDYTDKSVHLLVFAVTAFEGDARCNENQMDLRWISRNELQQFPFPEANKPIFEWLNVVRISEA